MPKTLPFLALEAKIIQTEGLLTSRELAEKLQTKIWWVFKMRRDGIRLSDADKYAIRAGFHPSEVWGNEWWKYGEDRL